MYEEKLETIKERIRTSRMRPERKTEVLHLLDEIESFTDRALFLREGRLICDVNPEEEREKTGRSIVELYREIM